MSDSTSRKVLELPRRNQVAAELGLAVNSAPQNSTVDEEKLFRLQVQLDMHRERELLYKVTLVIETIAALMLAREWAIWLLV
jgi:hypothetical protein